MLHSDLAKELYAFACTLPIVDYHNHLPLDDIRENRRFDNVYDLWIAPDPYKHRAMRMCGVPERLITGDEPRHKKFSAFCAVYPKLLGNPLYHWLAMEAQWLIGKSVALSAENADDIYHAMNRRLVEQPLTVDDLFTRFRVEKTCPCASLADDIGWMRKSAVCSPSLRGDDAVNVTAEFVKKLSGVSGTAITDLAAYKEAVRQRLDAFYVCGCQFADHALDNGFDYIADDGKNAGRFAEVLGGKPADSQLVSYLLTFLGHEYALRGMDKLNIHTLCFNWMAYIGWLRTTDRVPARGGAFTTGFDAADFVPTEHHITAGQLWENYTYFLKAIVPEAEKHGIKLALHPDDPPLRQLGNVSRIMISYKNIRHAVEDIVPSANLGVTMCQATFLMMGEDLYEIIPKLKDKIFFVHFRNAVGCKTAFHETFHDDGAIDMAKIMRCYKDNGIHVPIRVDHVPLLKGEKQEVAGYTAEGRLFAIGYLKGILDATR